MTGVESVPADLRCAAQMRAAGADPIGTAGTYHGYLLVEWPRPWPADVGGIPELAPLRAVVAEHARKYGEAIRVQALVPELADRRRVVVYRRAADPFAGYASRELGTAASPHDTTAGGVGLRLAGAASALLAGTAGDESARRDVLVCTHGRRDRCCGSWGTDLWQRLSATPLGDGIGLWRTSHTGGHRYAPTMVVLPEGTAWGFLDAETARRIVQRHGPVTDVLHTYRGCAGLGSPPLQALERAVLGKVGWSLLDTPRTGVDLGAGRLALTVGDGPTASRWEATVAPGRVLPVPECASLPGAGAKTSTEQVLTGLSRTA